MPQALPELIASLSELWTNSKKRQAYLKEEGAAYDQRGIRVYADLLSIGRNDLMLSVYPGCAKLLGKWWHDVVEDYFIQCPPRHYRLNNAAQAFPQYLEECADKHLEKYPFLAELAHYEWIELQTMEDDHEIHLHEHRSINKPEEFASLAPIINPTLTIYKYNFDVPYIVDCLTDDKPLANKILPKMTTIAVYRDPNDYHCRYLEISPLIEKLISASSTATYAELLRLCFEDIGADTPEAAVINFLEAIENLQSLYLFVGSKAVA